MKIRLGVAQTQTPPKPSSMPVKLVPVSKKTVRRSKRPSPSASSKIKIRSLPLRSAQPDRVGVVLDDPEPASGVDREGDRLDHVRLGREQRDGESLGHGHAASGLGGRDGCRRRSTGLSRLPGAGEMLRATTEP